MSEQAKPKMKPGAAPISLGEFLESVPPGQVVKVSDLANSREAHSAHQKYMVYEFAAPDIQLHCSDQACNGTRFFRCTSSSETLHGNDFNYLYVPYLCSNCQRQEKIFSLGIKRDQDALSGDCFKFGERPAYGPPISAPLNKLIRSDRETFLKGRRCENQSLGIGAFAYYRRVVENQKKRILQEIIKASKKLGADSEVIIRLEAAKKESQFKKAVDSVKDAIPPDLLIKGHNPLTLLHSALSEGLHEDTDEGCLRLARNIRVVLAELSDRLSQVLKDDAKINEALSRLTGGKAKPKKKQE